MLSTKLHARHVVIAARHPMPTVPAVDNTGVTKRLLKIVGTIQIFYMGARYNTPVGIWIPENYPSVPPNMMVEPTRGTCHRSVQRFFRHCSAQIVCEG